MGFQMQSANLRSMIMSKITQPLNNDFVYAEKNEEWLCEPSPFNEFDNDWKSLIIFYVFHVPVPDLSVRAKSLESFGWGSKSKTNDFKTLKSRLIKYGNMTKTSFACETSWAKLKESFKDNNLLNFPIDLTSERVAYRKTKAGENDSLLAHIRNSFAHGRLAFYNIGGETYIAMEDVDNSKHVSARMILSKKTLCRWKIIIESGPFKTDDELAVIIATEE